MLLVSCISTFMMIEKLIGDSLIQFGATKFVFKMSLLTSLDNLLSSVLSTDSTKPSSQDRVTVINAASYVVKYNNLN